MALSSFRPLHSRNFALVWSAALVSNVGSWMQTVALGFVITARTHQPLWTGLVAAAAFLPMGLLAPVGGALADRLDRRRWLIVTTVAEACFAAALAVLAAAGHAPPAVLVGVAFLGGVAAAVGFPTYQAMLPDLVPRDDLLAAVSLSSAQFNLGRVIGPALAGVVLVAGSDAWAFAVNAASFGAVVVALAFVRLPARTRRLHPVEGIVRRIVAGARVAAAEPGCRSAIILIAVVALVGSPFIGLVPAVAIDGLHRGAGATSALVTGQGIGAVAGALALAPLARVWGRRRLLVGALFAFPTAIVGYGLVPVAGDGDPGHRGRRHLLHRRPDRLEHRRPIAGPGTRAGAGARSLHDGSGDDLPDRSRRPGCHRRRRGDPGGDGGLGCPPGSGDGRPDGGPPDAVRCPRGRPRGQHGVGAVA